jgi:DNA-binding CsgD family transcriptional regulator/tetratricopeptide (TPR) repeat protein
VGTSSTQSVLRFGARGAIRAGAARRRGANGERVGPAADRVERPAEAAAGCVAEDLDFVGRDDDLRQVRALLGSSVIGGGGLVVLGEAGVGKTALLARVADIEAADGTRVVRAAAAQSESDTAYAGLNQLLIGLRGAFDRLDQDHRRALGTALGFTTGSPPSHMIVANASLLLVRAIAEERRLLLVVDDVPALDRDTAKVLAFLSRRLTGSSVRFLGAARTESAGPFEFDTLPQHRLLPLPDQAAQDLLDRWFPALPPSVRHRVVTEAAGNPLALRDLPEAMTASQRRAAEQLPAVLPLTDRLKDLYATRIRSLPAECRWMLLLAALDDDGQDAIRTAGPGCFEMLDPAERAHLVSIDPDARKVAFRHSLIRAAVVALSTVADRQRAHRMMADALTAYPERRALHLGEATSGPDEEVAALLERSARLAEAQGRSAGAVTTLIRAAELTPKPADQARRLALAAFLSAEAAGELETAARCLEECRIRGHAPLLAVAASTALLINGDGDVRNAHDLLASAIEAGDHGHDGTDEALSEAMHLLLLLSWYLGDEDAWKRCLAAFEKLGPLVDPALAIASRLYRDPARTDASTAEHLRTLLEDPHRRSDPAYVARVACLAPVLDWAGAAREDLWRVVRQGRAGTAPMRRHVTALATLCFDLFHGGHWDRLAEVISEGACLCEERGFTFARWEFRYQRALLAAARGDGEPAEADELMRWAPTRLAHGVEKYALQARALHHVGQGRYAAAYQDATAIGPAGTFAGHGPQALWAGFDLVEAAVRTGRRTEAAAHAAAMCELPVTGLSPRLTLLSAGAFGMVADDTEVRAAFDAALRTSGIDRWPFDQARVRLVYGERLRRLRAVGEAREQLTAAADIFHSLGARSWLRRANDEMRAAGMSRGRAVSSRFPALTPQEWEVAELAASGMTNKEIGERLFLSHRTVGSHLYQIFPKLGLTSRAGLRDALSAVAERRECA